MGSVLYSGGTRFEFRGVGWVAGGGGAIKVNLNGGRGGVKTWDDIQKLNIFLKYFGGCGVARAGPLDPRRYTLLVFLSIDQDV